MITQEEIKQFVIALGRRWLFPDFTNKLTWFVVSIGGTIILTPIAFKQILYNWLIATFNLNAGIPFTLAELGSSSADYFLGFGLIFLALIHNVANRYFNYKLEENRSKQSGEIAEVDKKLFQEFLGVFPSGGNSVLLLKDHDFGWSHHDSSTKEIERFVDSWNTAETKFLDPEIEKKREELWVKCHEFVYRLAAGSYSLGESMYSCVPDAYRDAWEWPDHVDKKIKELNKMATECFELYEAFVMLARTKLKC